MIRFIVIGEPKGQPRPRAVKFGNTARVYDPGTAEGWKGAILLEARPHLPPSPWSGPVRLSVVFKMTRPRGHFGSGRNADTLKASAPVHHLGKPDADNMLKALMDCLTGHVWRDDTQIVSVLATKRYTRPGERPGAEIEVAEIADQRGERRAG